MLSTRPTTSSACTLEALPLAHVDPYALTVTDRCTICDRTPAPLKVITFLPVARRGRDLRLAGEYRACDAHELLVVDAAHAAVADSPRHLVRTVVLHGHPRFDHGPSTHDVCTAGAAA